MKLNCAMLRRAIMAAGAITFFWPAVATDAANVSRIGTFYSDSLDKACGNNVFACEAVLGAVPANRILTVERVSCRIGVPSTAKIGALSLNRDTDAVTTSFQFLAPLNAISVEGGETYYLVNAETNLVYLPTDVPSVRLALRTATAFPKLHCTIHGTVKPAT